jgi:hypothetical protein
MNRRNVLIAIGYRAHRRRGGRRQLWYKRDTSPTVTTERLRLATSKRWVSASGKIQPKRLVNISADTPGRVVNLAVNEGESHHKRPISPADRSKSLRTRVDNSMRLFAGGESSLAQMRQRSKHRRCNLINCRYVSLVSAISGKSN